MFKLCLFDLDETLVRTDDIKDVRESGKNNDTAAYKRSVLEKLSTGHDRRIYSFDLIQKIRANFPNLKLGIFTRSPRSYATTVLEWAYPGFNWDIIVAYEDVEQTKPRGDGIDQAMAAFNILHTQYLPDVIMVGDSDVDVKAAYNCGCVVTLDKGAWAQRTFEHWAALEHVPDAIISAPGDLLGVLQNPNEYLPELERALATNGGPQGTPRFDKIGHFIPKSVGGDSTPTWIYVAGRSFANYDSLKFRRSWHALSKSIENHKESDTFSVEWIDTVRRFISKNYLAFRPRDIIVSVVPHRPKRKPRLEKFLEQLSTSLQAMPLRNLNVICDPKLFAYKDGVRSQHNDHLSRDERFVNVRDHLFVQDVASVQPRTAFLLIDDVVTTGASLIYAAKYLTEAGATDVTCLSMAKNVGNLFYDEER